MSKPVIINLSDTIGIISKVDYIKSDVGGFGIFYPIIIKHAQYIKAIEEHGRLCSLLIPKSIEMGIPVRGATSIGEFEMYNNSFVGKAIDEVASWYQTADWIGVHITPTALMDLNISPKYWKLYDLPLGNSKTFQTYCVDWTTEWGNDINNLTAREVLKIYNLLAAFQEMGPLTPDIASKYINTCNYYFKIHDLSWKDWWKTRLAENSL